MTPGYYDGAGGMQPFDVIDAFGLDFYEGNIIKYIVRWRKKDGLDDLYKARTYIGALIKRAEMQHIAGNSREAVTAVPGGAGRGTLP